MLIGTLIVLQAYRNKKGIENQVHLLASKANTSGIRKSCGNHSKQILNQWRIIFELLLILQLLERFLDENVKNFCEIRFQLVFASVGPQSCLESVDESLQSAAFEAVHDYVQVVFQELLEPVSAYFLHRLHNPAHTFLYFLKGSEVKDNVSENFIP